MKAGHFIQKFYPIVSPFDGTDAVRDKILATGYVVVMEDGKFKGLLTPQDIIKSPRNLIIDCIQKKPLIKYEQSIDSIISRMKDSGFDILPVMQEGIFKGVILQSDIVAFFSEYSHELEGKINAQTEKLLEINQKLKQEIKDREIAENEKNELLIRMHHSEKVAAIGTLAAGIAHDFNNILSPIIGFSEIAMRDAKQGTSLWSDLNEIYSAGNRAKELVKQILKYTRQKEQIVESIKLRTVLNEALKLIEASFPASVKILQNIETDAFIKADPTMIHQIYMNLCTNALHAMEKENGILEIQAKNILFLHDSECIPNGLFPGEYVELSVSDNGIGILPENIKRVFDPYFTTKPVGKGTGLGLSTVYGIVKGYGGTIHIESNPGQGTSVYIYLPITKQEPAALFNLTAQEQNGHEKILFVDDEESITRLFKKSLERAGYQVEIKTDPLAALTFFKSEPDAFDLVITDMTMPTMQGDTLTYELKRIRPEIPVILCSGYSNMLSESRIKELDLQAVVNKPILSSELAKTIREVLDADPKRLSSCLKN